jgi:hypothetical protein
MELFNNTQHHGCLSSSTVGEAREGNDLYTIKEATCWDGLVV